MRMAAGILLMVSAVVPLGGSAAHAMSAVGMMAAVRNCQNTELAAHVRIEACGQAIHTNIASPSYLARLYFHRAAAYEAASDFEHSLTDYNKALELAPDFAEAQSDRTRLMERHPASSSK